MYSWEWNFVWEYRALFLRGIVMTVWLSLLTIVFGTALGAATAFAKRSKNGTFRFMATIYVEVFRAIPLLALLHWVYFVLPIVFGLHLFGFGSAVIALVLNLSAFACENIRAGLESITDAQRESGLALGLSPWQTNKRVIFPQAVKNILPNLMDQWITSVKLTSLASVIGVEELLNTGSQINTLTARPFEVYTVLAVLYCAVIFLLTVFAKIVERKVWK